VKKLAPWILGVGISFWLALVGCATPTRTPIRQVGVLPAGFHYTYRCSYLSHGFPVDWDPIIEFYFDREFGARVDCEEAEHEGGHELYVHCQTTYTGDYFKYLQPVSTTHTWNPSTGVMTDSTGWWGRARRTDKAATFTWMGAFVEATVWEYADSRPLQTSGGDEWSQETLCTLWRHPQSNLTLLRSCDVKMFVHHEGVTRQAMSMEIECVLTDTNLDL
jgi:hypothetical protein